ncbi:hypothetical protein [Sphingopyxis sp.]|uniref:hypothetical protein n=1 Tax=Sphingopyxis sp. TaxID=1908224 RepID=UPI002D789819|nr:hypothetical protein [Sphingopyxis sp.]HET6523248.1 hypothetical protein [Sphingopyxis sp.]
MAGTIAKAREGGRARSSLSPDRFALILWCGFFGASLFLNRDAIAHLSFSDPDNAMRLAQVRDLVAGQNWFDTTQYRTNPGGGGGPTHWSRFIDAPIAGSIWLIGLFVEARTAERLVLAAYPPLLALPLLLVLSRILQMLGDRASVFFGLAIAATTISYLHHFAPLNIDHHNWQILLSVTLLWLALRPATIGNGLLSALIASIYVEISLEGFPFLGFFWALFVFDWLHDPSKADRLRGFSAGMILLPALWSLPFRGPAYLSSVFCDSFSLPYILAAALAGTIFVIAISLRPATSLAQRLGVVLVAGMAAAAGFALTGPSCLGGPFGELEPFVRTYWYDPIFEGRPLWVQTPARMLGYAIPTVVGVAASLWACGQARDRPESENRVRLALVISFGAIMACLVVRTIAVAHAFMIPAFAALAAALWRRADAQPNSLRRLGGVLLFMLAIPTVDMALGFRLMSLQAGSPAVASAAPTCLDRSTIALADEPPALLFSAVNIAPTLLVRTPHSVVTTGHHRNHATLHRVLSAFLAPPALARPLVSESGAQYLVFCDEELARLAPGNPDGLAARLLARDRIDWLKPETRLSSGSFHVYRILRPDRESARSTGNPARY